MSVNSVEVFDPWVRAARDSQKHDLRQAIQNFAIRDVPEWDTKRYDFLSKADSIFYKYSDGDYLKEWFWWAPEDAQERVLAYLLLQGCKKEKDVMQQVNLVQRFTGGTFVGGKVRDVVAQCMKVHAKLDDSGDSGDLVFYSSIGDKSDPELNTLIEEYAIEITAGGCVLVLSLACVWLACCRRSPRRRRPTRS